MKLDITAMNTDYGLNKNHSTSSDTISRDNLQPIGNIPNSTSSIFTNNQTLDS